MSAFALVAAKPHHVPALAAGLCPEDVLELRALGYEDPAVAIEGSLEVSETAFVMLFDEVPGAIFGVVKTPWGGRLWLLTATVVQQRPRDFLRAAKVATALLVARYGVLANETGIDARHSKALRLAQHLGFALGEPRSVGVNGEPFVPFHQERAA